MRVKYLNIDHNTEYILLFPVIFTPMSHLDYKNQNNQKFFLNIILE
jgi:hypothetical protein